MLTLMPYCATSLRALKKELLVELIKTQYPTYSYTEYIPIIEKIIHKIASSKGERSSNISKFLKNNKKIYQRNQEEDKKNLPIIAKKIININQSMRYVKWRKLQKRYPDLFQERPSLETINKSITFWNKQLFS
jgi:hypothetical protein